MKICYIADGISLHTQRWVNYFASKGHEVHVISNRFPANCKGYDKNIELHNLMTVFPKLGTVARYLSFVPWIFQVRRLIREINPDILDAHYITVYGYLGAFSGFHPLVLTAWGSDILITTKKNPIHKFLTMQALRRADHIICVSPILQEEIVKLGAAPSKIMVTPIGVDTQKFNPEARNEALLRKLDINGPPVVISTRNLGSVYDVGTLIRAIPLVLQELPQAKFIIAGDGEQRGYLEHLAETLGISGSIRFVGWIPNSELPGYLTSSDVYVSTSLSDGTSISLLEALACGLAPVVTDIPANRPWVNDNENGFLVAVRDYDILASKITLLLKDSETRARFGKAARNVVIERADYEVEMAKVMRGYESIIKANSNSKRSRCLVRD